MTQRCPACRPPRSRTATTIVVASLVVPALASAQSAQDKAAAATLFDEARRLLAENKIPQACEKFEASQALDPAPGTLLNLADCQERAGRTATAWVRFRDAAALAKSTGDLRREQAARERATALEPKLVRLAIRVAPESDVPGLEIRRDGEKIDKVLWGSAVPVDPGAHTIAATAPGKKPWSKSFDASQPGTTVTADVGPLEAAPTVAPPPVTSAPPPATASATPPPPPPTTPPPPPTTEKPSGTWGPQKTWAVVAGGLGVVGVGAGTVLGLGALSKFSDAKKHCTNGTTGCDAQANSLSKDALSEGNVSTVAFAIGIAGIGAGVALWLTAPKTEETGSVWVAPSVAKNAASLAVGGSFR